MGFEYSTGISSFSLCKVKFCGDLMLIMFIAADVLSLLVFAFGDRETPCYVW